MKIKGLKGRFPIIIFMVIVFMTNFATMLDAQEMSAYKTKYANYYIFPIRTNQQNFLSGTMGELRTNHFHGGLDIKTSGITGLPVYATAEGYVSRIKVSTWGYGNCLYITHPNGTTSVYAHLKEFSGEVADYVRNAQYAKQTFEIELFPKKGELSFNQGDIVAKSGNSGSSMGPHLHFEIRDENQVPFNPLLIGFKEIKDTTPPSLIKIALVTLDKNARINGQYGRFEYSVEKFNGNYVIPEDVSAFGKIGLQLLCFDRLDGANNKNGVPFIDLSINGDTIYSQKLDRVPFAHNRHILLHCDFATQMATRKKFNKLYVEDGNSLRFNDHNDMKGAFWVEMDSSYQANVVLKDAYGNASSLKFHIVGENKFVSSKNKAYHPSPNNILMLTDDINKTDSTDDKAAVFTQRKKVEILPAYVNNNESVYLWDLRYGMPDSIKIKNNEAMKFNFQAQVPYKQEMKVYGQNFDIHFFKKTLFDTLYLHTEYRYDSLKKKETFKINDKYTPLKSNMEITLKPQKEYNQEKAAAYKVKNSKRHSYIGGYWKNDQLNFKTREFGEITILEDSLAPTIKALRINSKDLRFVIKDDLSGIKSFNAYIDDEWVLMNYDYKRALIWSEKLDPKKPFKGELILKVSDFNNNEKIFKQTIQ